MAIKKIVLEDKIFDISYEIINPNCSKDIVFLHGWGSNKDIMKNVFSKYLSNFRHIYIDMPGFGKSQNNYILSTNDYKEIIEIFLENINSSKNVILGHSFGGKVAVLLNPKNLILLSSAGILEKKSFSVKFKIFLTKIFKTIGLKSVLKSFRSKDVYNMSENMYETFKNVLNEDFSNHFANFSNNALIFWGKDDTATSLQAGKKISKLIKNSNFEVFEGDHFFFVKNANLICQRIENEIF